MKPKVSIVVPIYRVEPYLSQCVDSLLAQTLKEIEIILVDDGSPDRCGEIADEYAKKEPRVKVIHQENAGLGPARNSGMAAAAGEYIGFVDSDDWVKPEMFERLYQVAKQQDADIVVSGHCDYTDGKVVRKKKHPLAGKTLSTTEEIRAIRKNLYGHGLNDREVESFPMSVCMSIYKKGWLQSHVVEFKKILSEDTIFNLKAYQYAKKISFTGQTDYCYRKENQNSITLTFAPEKREKYQDFLTEIVRMAEEEQDEDCVLRAKRMAIDCCRLYTRMIGESKISFKDKKKYLREFAQTREIAQCWEDYPIGTLPIQQHIFHRMILKRQYGQALILNSLRRGKGRLCKTNGNKT